MDACEFYRGWRAAPGAIVLHREVLRAVGDDLVVCCFLDRLLFWAGQSAGREWWVYKTFDQWREEVGLSRREVRRSVDVLAGRGLIETRRCPVRDRGNPQFYRVTEFGRECLAALLPEGAETVSSGKSNRPERAVPGRSEETEAGGSNRPVRAVRSAHTGPFKETGSGGSSYGDKHGDKHGDKQGYPRAQGAGPGPRPEPQPQPLSQGDAVAIGALLRERFGGGGSRCDRGGAAVSGLYGAGDEPGSEAV